MGLAPLAVGFALFGLPLVRQSAAPLFKFIGRFDLLDILSTEDFVAIVTPDGDEIVLG